MRFLCYCEFAPGHVPFRPVRPVPSAPFSIVSVRVEAGASQLDGTAPVGGPRAG